jgi:hypothetical protein
MASIIISFVGSQDPGSTVTNQEGSIVTLVKYLLAEKYQIKHIFLLYTEATANNAQLTQEWITDLIEDSNIQPKQFDLIEVSQQFSADPINLLLAINEAKKIIKKAQIIQDQNDYLELNSSSGTPTMKTAWATLQCARQIPNSRIWQVRNPREIKENQERVFPTNVDSLNKEFDLKIIKTQVSNYNYNGALTTFKSSNLTDNGLGVYLEYGANRLASNFSIAQRLISKYKSFFPDRLVRDINLLTQKNQIHFLIELFEHTKIKLESQEYANALVLLFAFQEAALRYMVRENLTPELKNKSWNRDMEDILLKKIENYDQGKLYDYLQKYRLRNGQSLKLYSLNRIIMLAILEYFSVNQQLLNSFNNLEKYCEQRNDFVHQFEGVANISDKEIHHIINNIRVILAGLTTIPSQNSFQVLNEKIDELIDYQY